MSEREKEGKKKRRKRLIPIYFLAGKKEGGVFTIDCELKGKRRFSRTLKENKKKWEPPLLQLRGKGEGRRTQILPSLFQEGRSTRGVC